MVFIAPFIGAVALLSTMAAAVPMPYSSSDSSSSDSSSYSPPSSSDDSSSGSYGSSSGSSYGSSGSSYGSSGSSYGGSSEESSSAPSYGSSNAYSSAPPQYTQTQAYTQTQSASSSYSTPSYGSGMSSWGGSGYDDCVSQCVASYGAPPSTYTPPSSSDNSSSNSSSYSGSSGSGATHTVIVAPTQGVLRYVPFALNASVGDTVMFMWGANNHTVTKSSELLPCNKSAEAPVFASGTQNQSFMFSQVVNDTSPTFFYCGTPGHCEKGMFGIINPPNAFGASTSLGMAMPAMAANDSGMAALMSTNNMMTANNSGAASWGMNIDLASLPTWSHSLVAENTVYTRSFLASNPEVLNADGSVDLSQAGANPLMIPQDISTAIDASSSNGTAVAAAAASGASSAAAGPSATTSGAPAASSTAHSGASIASPSMLIAFVAVVGTIFAL